MRTEEKSLSIKRAFTFFRRLLLLALLCSLLSGENSDAKTLAGESLNPALNQALPGSQHDFYFSILSSRASLAPVPLPANHPTQASGRALFSSGNAREGFYRVLRVVDGDSLEIEGVGEVRLIGVDTPELYHPLKPIQYYAQEASNFVRQLVSGSRVRLEYDREKFDKYGRTLAYVYLEDGRCLNEEIIKNGYGFALTRFPFKNLKKYRQLEAQARKEGLGLWGNQGLDEFCWILSQAAVPYEIFEMANNWWAIRYKDFVRLRLTAEELQRELINLRQWTNEFSPSDLEKMLLNNGWLKVDR